MLKELLTNGLVLRRLLRATERQADSLDRIADLLTRLTDQLAPPEPVVTADDLRKTEVAFSRDAEQVAIQEFTARFQRTVGREPTDDEVFEHLTEPAR